MATKNEIDLLRLAPRAKTAAVLVNEKFPEVVFTSGLRDINKQAAVMARNLMVQPNWVERVYVHGGELQEQLNKRPDLFQNQAALHVFILKYFESKPEIWLAHFSRHFAGYAFDIQPWVDRTGIVTAQGFKLIEFLRFGIGAEKVLLKEGNLLVWHVQFTPTEEV